jgi:translation elongation factor EF-G
MEEDEEIRAEVSINIKGEKKNYEMLVKDIYEIEDCPKGKIVVLIGHDESQWTGTFVGTDDEEIIIASLDNPDSRIALNISGASCYLEEIEEIPYAEEIKD